MASATQVIKTNECTKTEYCEKSAIGALYDELSKGIKSLKKGNVLRLMKLGRNYGNPGLERPHVLAIHYKENAENQQIKLLQSSSFGEAHIWE